MRGKKSYTFPCMCCGARDLRGEYDDLLARREIRDAMTSTQGDCEEFDE
jgi:hypothetical protein